MEEEHKFEDIPSHKKRKTTTTANSNFHQLDKIRKAKLDEELKTVDSNLFDQEGNSNVESQAAKIRKQIEFYFGDANLRKDKFLTPIIKNDKKGYVDISIFLGFNRIKNMIGQTRDSENGMNIITNALASSEMLKMNKAKTKVRRKLAFLAKKDIEKEIEVDKRTVYIENLPEDIDHEAMAKIFSKCGKILLVQLPKYSESRITKGFGFIEFSAENEAQAAIRKYNNTVPIELAEQSLLKGKSDPLKVISKTQWLQLKQEFKAIKKELVQHLQDTHEDHNNQERGIQAPDLKYGCLVKLSNLPVEEVDKTIIRTSISNFCTPKYVDYRKGHSECIVRFENSSLAEEFINRCVKADKLLINNKEIHSNLIQGEEEEKYLAQVKQHQVHLRQYSSEKHKLHKKVSK